MVRDRTRATVIRYVHRDRKYVRLHAGLAFLVAPKRSGPRPHILSVPVVRVQCTHIISMTPKSDDAPHFSAVSPRRAAGGGKDAQQTAYTGTSSTSTGTVPVPVRYSKPQRLATRTPLDCLIGLCWATERNQTIKTDNQISCCCWFHNGF